MAMSQANPPMRNLIPGKSTWAPFPSWRRVRVHREPRGCLLERTSSVVIRGLGDVVETKGVEYQTLEFLSGAIAGDSLQL
jgi:hypothetical protein